MKKLTNISEQLSGGQSAVSSSFLQLFQLFEQELKESQSYGSGPEKMFSFMRPDKTRTEISCMKLTGTTLLLRSYD